jgi:chromosome segregation ATPase
MSETLTLFRRGHRREAVFSSQEELARRDEAIASLRRRLGYLQTALDASARERVSLQAAVRELTAYRQETEALTLTLGDVLREHRAALAALEQALG